MITAIVQDKSSRVAAPGAFILIRILKNWQSPRFGTIQPVKVVIYFNMCKSGLGAGVVESLFLNPILLFRPPVQKISGRSKNGVGQPNITESWVARYTA